MLLWFSYVCQRWWRYAYLDDLYATSRDFGLRHLRARDPHDFVFIAAGRNGPYGVATVHSPVEVPTFATVVTNASSEADVNGDTDLRLGILHYLPRPMDVIRQRLARRLIPIAYTSPHLAEEENMSITLQN